jgi:23S rRNA (uracil1939-C5)-methyltransferase
VTRPTAPSKHLVDVYCGVGFLGIELADLVTSVAGVEYDQKAIAAARRNAKARGLTNVEFIAGAAEEKLPELLSRFTPAATTVLLDPPRRGCDRNLLDLLRHIQPAQIIYVSCHPATMARDLNALCSERVFDLVQALPLDMFPQTQHVECIADLRGRPLPPEQTELANAASMVSTVPAT